MKKRSYGGPLALMTHEAARALDVSLTTHDERANLVPCRYGEDAVRDAWPAVVDQVRKVASAFDANGRNNFHHLMQQVIETELTPYTEDFEEAARMVCLKLTEMFNQAADVAEKEGP